MNKPNGTPRAGWFVGAGMLGMVLVGSACTTSLYAGAGRPFSEVGSVSASSNVELISLDGVEVQGGRFGRYELLPGPHKATFQGRRSSGFLFFEELEKSRPLTLCFLVEPGHRYQLMASLESNTWETWVRDRVTDRHALGCKALISPAHTNSSEAAAVLDRNASRAVLPRTPRPGNGPEFFLGYDFGGETLVTARMSDGSRQEISGGGGLFLGLGGVATPFWFEDTIGIGIASRIGVKFDQVGGTNASVQKVSFPFSAGIRSYVHMDSTWYLGLGGGANKELAPSLSSSGDLQGGAAFTSPWGGYGEIGLVSFSNWHTVYGITLRYTRMSLQYGGSAIRGDNLGLTFSYQPNP
jgi:hypothetical protein